MEAIRKAVYEAMDYLLGKAQLPPGDLAVLGCSTSEIGGAMIGKAGSPEVGRAVVSGAMDACAAHGVVLAVQCCEHLNRALVLPREAALRLGHAPVAAVPFPHAGGSCGAAYYRLLQDPVLVEQIQAGAGLDIGDTLIGMHLRPVAVPLRPAGHAVGQAHLVMATTRPKFIGGARAHYTLDDE
ncbi:MAG: TIGR01440 family protein [Oscillospiraceae bacterium]|jgi:uncharacterized protein (TIGR01440 family)|nr:TIGR01440 family protein [Oscillospiraceae bacterium]